MWKWVLNAVNEFTPLLCLCLRPSLVKSCPLIKVLPLSSFRLRTHTHTHTRYTWNKQMKGHATRVLQEAMASVECCFIFLLIPLCLCFFVEWAQMHACVCVCCWFLSATHSQIRVIKCTQSVLSHWSADWDRKTWKTISCFSSMYASLLRREITRKNST